jgi:hypothetical protein
LAIGQSVGPGAVRTVEEVAAKAAQATPKVNFEASLAIGAE